MTRTAVFPLLSELVLDAEAPEASYKWHLRLSGDFYRILRHHGADARESSPPGTC